jgi:hypothetical protein
MEHRLVLQYSRNIRDGGRVSGRVVFVDDNDDVVSVEDQFELVEFPQMIRSFANFAKAHPNAQCFFQRIDKLGFPITAWSAQHVEQFRSDPEKVVAELSAVRTVTVDTRNKEQE